MKKTHIKVDFENETLNMTKSFYNKARRIGSPEYKELREAMKENDGYSIEILSNENKKTYRSLTFDRMRDYIKTQPNSAENLATLDRVIAVAEAKGAKYPATKKWFLETFPEYKESEVMAKELNSDDAEVITSMKNVA